MKAAYQAIDTPLFYNFILLHTQFGTKLQRHVNALQRQSMTTTCFL